MELFPFKKPYRKPCQINIVRDSFLQITFYNGIKGLLRRNFTKPNFVPIGNR